MLRMMRALAEFERYVDIFGITDEFLREHMFRKSPPDLYCVVAEGDGGELVGRGQNALL